MVASQAVTARIGSSEAQVSFAGLTPGFVGLYQINAVIPAAVAPGLNLQFAVSQGNFASNLVGVAVQ